MIKELDTVVLTRDVKEHGLERGDLGAVVHCYADGEAFEVEFVTAEGGTVALLTLIAGDIRPVGKNDLLHVRELAPPDSPPRSLTDLSDSSPGARRPR